MSRRERMSAADAAWLHMDRSTNLMVINGVVWFDATLDWNVLTKRIQARWVDRYPRFRQRVAEGRLPLRAPALVPLHATFALSTISRSF